MTLAAICLAIGAVVGFAFGQRTGARRERAHRLDAMEQAYERGRTVGGDELANDYLAAAAAAGDPLDAWPRSRGGRPS